MSDEIATQEAWRRGSQGAQAAYARRRITIDPDHPPRGARQDRHLPQRSRRRRPRLPPGPGAARLREVRRGPPRRGRCRRSPSRICGVCPTAHHMAATKALDAVYKVEPPPAAKKLRELVYSGFVTEDHALHFYFLGGPDFVVGPEAPAAQRNILGVIATVGQEVGLRVITMRRRLREIITLAGGKVIHPVLGLPGGVAKRITAEQQAQIKETAADAVDFARFTLGVFRSVVLANPAYVDLIVSDAFTHRTYYMGLMDEQNRPNFYDGRIRVVTPEGGEWPSFAPADYLDFVAEHVEPWSYVKFCYLKPLGWHGFTDGAESGIYSVAPLARLNAADAMATPLAQEAYEEMSRDARGQAGAPHPRQPLGPGGGAALRRGAAQGAGRRPGAHRPKRAHPSHRDAARGRRRCRGAARHAVPPLRDRLARDRGAGQPDRGHPEQLGAHGDERGEGGQGADLEGEVSEGILNKVEMAFRAYDPCHACATHSLPGSMPLVVAVRGSAGETLSLLRRDSDGSLHRE